VSVNQGRVGRRQNVLAVELVVQKAKIGVSLLQSLQEGADGLIRV
jgi:hypothetical protein